MRYAILYCLFWGLSSFLMGQNTPVSANVLTAESDSLIINVDTTTVFFRNASSKVTDSFSESLQGIVQTALFQCDSIQLFGHTDNVGDSIYNMELSKRRALAVRDVLLKGGIAENRIVIYALGEKKPMANNEFPQGRALNRRVFLKVFTSEALMSDGIRVAPMPFRPEVDPEIGDTAIYSMTRRDELMDSLSIPPGASVVEGPLPKIKYQSSLSFKSVQKYLTSSNGSTVMVNYDYNSGKSRPKSILFKAVGSSFFYDIPLEITDTSGVLGVPVGFSTILGEGEVELVAVLTNEEGVLSQPDTSYVEVVRVGTGNLQVSLSWTNDTDQDLYIVGPDGNTINYINPYGAGGGRLDRDDTDGIGPENIYWNKDAPDGTYQVKVHDYTVTFRPNEVVVTLIGPGINRQYFLSTANGEFTEVVTFEKVGNRLIIEKEPAKARR